MIKMPNTWPMYEYKDGATQKFIDDMGPDKSEVAYAGVRRIARDHGRTPMQWDESRHAGFSTINGETWMRVNDSFPEINVARQESDPASVLNFYRKVIKLRLEERAVFVYGSFEMVDETGEDTVLIVKRGGGRIAFVALNFTSRLQEFDFPQGIGCPRTWCSLPWRSQVRLVRWTPTRAGYI